MAAVQAISHELIVTTLHYLIRVSQQMFYIPPVTITGKWKRDMQFKLVTVITGVR